jgi:hypothetical protein
MQPMSKKPHNTEIELVPDAWQRFERAAGVVSKTPPQHRVAKKKNAKKKNAKKKTSAKKKI